MPFHDLLHSVLLVLLLIPNTALASTTNTPPTPASPASSRALKELTLKVRYPEFFQPVKGKNKRDDPVPSHEVCTDECPSFPGFFINCEWVPDMRKRDVDEVKVEKRMLQPKDAAEFFLGMGRFTMPNGTVTVDDHYLSAGEKRRYHQLRSPRRANSWVRTALGNLVMDLGVPVYKRWKNRYRGTPDYEFMLSETHGIYMGDVHEIEQALLDVPGWQEFEVAEWRISRRFLELVHEL